MKSSLTHHRIVKIDRIYRILVFSALLPSILAVRFHKRFFFFSESLFNFVSLNWIKFIYQQHRDDVRQVELLSNPVLQWEEFNIGLHVFQTYITSFFHHQQVALMKTSMIFLLLTSNQPVSLYPQQLQLSNHRFSQVSSRLRLVNSRSSKRSIYRVILPAGETIFEVFFPSRDLASADCNFSLFWTSLPVTRFFLQASYTSVHQTMRIALYENNSTTIQY